MGLHDSLVIHQGQEILAYYPNMGAGILIVVTVLGFSLLVTALGTHLT